MSPEEQKDWEEKQLDSLIDLNNCHIDPAPFQLGTLSNKRLIELQFKILTLLFY